jgi:hypothetical protein
MTATAQDLTFYAGETVVISSTVTEDGVAKDLNGCSLTFKIAKEEGGAAIVTKTSATLGGIAVIDADAGTITITLSATDTGALLSKSAYIHELKLTDAGSAVSVLSTGAILVTKLIA